MLYEPNSTTKKIATFIKCSIVLIMVCMLFNTVSVILMVLGVGWSGVFLMAAITMLILSSVCAGFAVFYFYRSQKENQDE
jgi:hypothetical protein